MIHPLRWLGVTIIASVSLVMYLGNEAYKEVFYVCGNIRPGDAQSEVLRQLDTTDFSYVTQLTSGRETQILLASHFAPALIRCDIRLDADKYVIRVERQRLFD